jgi:hypothetical protein
VDDEAEIVQRHVKGRIMIDAVCFQEQNSSHPWPRVRKTRPRCSDSGPCDSASLEYLNPAQLEQSDLLICSPTVLGFCLESKHFVRALSLPGIYLTNESHLSLLLPISWTLRGAPHHLMMSNSRSSKRDLSSLTKSYLTRNNDEKFQTPCVRERTWDQLPALVCHKFIGVSCILCIPVIVKKAEFQVRKLPFGGARSEPAVQEKALHTIGRDQE